MIPTSKQIRIGIARLRQQSASTEWPLRNLGGGDPSGGS